jgi:exopolysaccharide biosynthesis glucuronosyltransferase PssE
VIFVTVGTQLAFDRLIRTVDSWAADERRPPVFAQIGPSSLTPRYVEHARFIGPEECAERMREATAIVAHAGMGTILTALELGTPLLVMPRKASFGEHRNDHQLATARRFAELGRVHVAYDEVELPRCLDELQHAAAQPRISRYASDELVSELRAFITHRSSKHVAASSTERALH